QEDELLKEVYTAIRAADERKAGDVRCLKVSHLTVMTEYMIILVGTSRPQNQAIAANIIELMEEKHERICKQQGTPSSGWILLDYGDLIVHIMTPKSRAYYDLDGYWANGEDVDLSQIIKPD
ncbi:unnamed protein product, partial [Chrysoparadoxa australica]